MNQSMLVIVDGMTNVSLMKIVVGNGDDGGFIGRSILRHDHNAKYKI